MLYRNINFLGPDGSVLYVAPMNKISVVIDFDLVMETSAVQPDITRCDIIRNK